MSNSKRIADVLRVYDPAVAKRYEDSIPKRQSINDQAAFVRGDLLAPTKEKVSAYTDSKVVVDRSKAKASHGSRTAQR